MPRRPPESALLLLVDDLVVGFDHVLVRFGFRGFAFIRDLGFLVVESGLRVGALGGFGFRLAEPPSLEIDTVELPFRSVAASEVEWF